MRFILLGLVLLCCFGCKGGKPNAGLGKQPIPANQPGNQVEAEPENPLDAKIAAIKKKLAASKEANDTIGTLMTQQELSRAEAERYRAIAADAEDKAKSKDREIERRDDEIRAEKLKQHQERLIIGAVLSIAAAVICFGLGFWINVPTIRKILWGAAVAFAGVAAICFFVSWLLPYMIYIGGAIAVGVVIAVVVHLHRSNRDDKHNTKTIEQVIEAVEAIKDKVPGYKDIFARFIDSDVDEFLDKHRTRLGYLEPKDTKKDGP